MAPGGSQRREGLPLEQPAIESDLRRSVAGIELSEPDAAVRIWHGFLEHAGRPVAFAGPPHPDNDVLAFEVERPHNTQDVIVRFQRRLGVESADLEYLGTIIAACYLLVIAGTAWERIPDPIAIWVHGTLLGEPRGLDSFRCRVESSEAFAALAASRVSERSRQPATPECRISSGSKHPVEGLPLATGSDCGAVSSEPRRLAPPLGDSQGHRFAARYARPCRAGLDSAGRLR